MLFLSLLYSLVCLSSQQITFLDIVIQVGMVQNEKGEGGLLLSVSVPVGGMVPADCCRPQGPVIKKIPSHRNLKSKAAFMFRFYFFSFHFFKECSTEYLQHSVFYLEPSAKTSFGELVYL